MKILLVTHRFYSSSGGGSYVIYSIAKNLQKSGHEVTIICSDVNFQFDYVNELIQIGITIIPFKSYFSFGQFYLTWDISIWIKENIKNFDIVHLNGVRNYQNLKVIKYAKKYNVPLILQAHGSIEKIGNHKIVKSIFDILFFSLFITNISKYIALSQSEMDAHMRMGIDKEKIVIIPNGINIEDYYNLPINGSFKKQFSIPESKKIILYIGRIDQTKGIDLLIKSYKLLLNEDKELLLVIGGIDDGYKRSLIKLVKNYNLENDILFTGYISQIQKISAFIDSKIFVTPRFYGFPITFIESCACGLPLVTTNGGDDLEWIDGYVGYTSKFDEQELSLKIFEIISNSKLHNEFSRNCKKLVITSLNWSVIIKKFEQTYKEIIKVNKI